MKNLYDKMLRYIAKKAENAAYDTSGFASRRGCYEPKLSEEAKSYKATHTSKIELFFNRLMK